MGMQYDFDTMTDRRNTNCGKWDTMDQKYGRKDMIHLGVADMDFKAPDPILNGLRDVLDMGVLGYTNFLKAYSAGTGSSTGWRYRENGSYSAPESISLPASAWTPIRKKGMGLS